MKEVFFEISVIVACASALAWLAARARQPIIMGYLLCGVLVGPWGMGLVHQVELVDSIARIGVTLLLFLAGMVLHPRRLAQLFQRAILVTLGGGLISLAIVFVVLSLSGFGYADSFYAGLAMMFSSTILVVKLLPTTTLHQRHMGSVCIAVLIAQDLLAIVLLLLIGGEGQGAWLRMGILLPLKGLVFVALAVGVEQFILRRMMQQTETYHELLYMLCLGWCLGLASLADRLGLSYEIGAFIAGVALARSPLSRFLSEQLKPIRDFFLMFFFFVLGARLDLLVVRSVWLPAILVGLLLLVLRPVSLRMLFRVAGERAAAAREASIRLGQGSEFGLILAVAAEQAGRLSFGVFQVVQLAIILTMIISSYLVVSIYPSPLATSKGLKQD